MLEQADFARHIGKDNVLPHIQAALERAREIRAEFDGLGTETASDLQTAPM